MEEFFNKVLTSNLRAGEIKLLMLIQMAREKSGAFKRTNQDICKMFKVSRRTVQYWLEHLEEKQLIKIFMDNRNHTRIIRLDFGKQTRALEYAEMSEAQKKFFDAFPSSQINAEIPENIDIDKFIAKIQCSKNLKPLKFASLKWYLDRYDDIMNDAWKGPNSRKSNFSTGREYTREEMNSLFQNIDDIVI